MIFLLSFVSKMFYYFVHWSWQLKTKLYNSVVTIFGARLFSQLAKFFTTLSILFRGVPLTFKNLLVTGENSYSQSILKHNPIPWIWFRALMVLALFFLCGWHVRISIDRQIPWYWNNCFNTNIYSYLETSGGQSSNLYLNAVHFFNASVN